MVSKMLLALLVAMVSSQGIRAQKSDLIDSSLIPYWKSTLMHNESVLMVARDNQPPTASLLFPATKILSVRNSALSISYEEGIDWKFENGKLLLLPASRAISMKHSELFPSEKGNTFPKKDSGYILFHEGSFFHNKQLAISYYHEQGQWRGPIPKYSPSILPGTIRKLKNKSVFTILLYGDSIAAGYNASAESNSAPHLPNWGHLIVEGLKRYYKTPVTFTNSSVPGKDSRWAVSNIYERVIKYQPDLVVLAFGMNDGTQQMKADTFAGNIRMIIEKVRKENPLTEFILVAPMLPNPLSNFTGTQELFKDAMVTLTGNGILLIDMTEVHRELLKHKAYADLTGNHINHPNDFLIRWYAQQILYTLIP